MEDREITNNFRVNVNPLASKTFSAMLTDKSLGDIINECLNELVSGCEFNSMDMPFYMAAIDLLKSSLETTLDDTDKELYNDLMKTCNLTTIHVNKTDNEITP